MKQQHGVIERTCVISKIEYGIGKTYEKGEGEVPVRVLSGCCGCAREYMGVACYVAS